MLKNEKISITQFMFLLIGSRLIIDLTYNLAFISPPANQDVWISTFVSFFVTLIFVLPILLLGKKYPDKTIIQYSEILLGGIAGKVVGLLYVWFFLHVAANTMRLFGEYFTAAPMPETPLLVFLVTFVIVATYAVYNGLEVIGRLSEIIIPINLVLIIIISFLVIIDMNLNSLKPLLEKGVSSVLYGAVISASRTVEPLLLAMLGPYINNKKKKTLGYVFAMFIVIIFLTIIDIQILSSIGPNQVKLLSFPYVVLLRRIKFADIIERIDFIHIGIWILGNSLKLALYYYLAVLGISQIFNVKFSKLAIIPVGFIILLLSVLLYPNLVQLEEFLSYKIHAPYNLFFILGIPTLLMLVSLLKKDVRNSN